MTTAETLTREAQKALFAKANPDGRYSVTMAQTGGKNVAKVQIYGVIGDWWDGLDAATLASTIADTDADEIEVHLNSPGGIAFDGAAIYNALKQHEASVRIHVDGLAASAASLIAMAGDDVVMELGSQMMLHNPSGLCYGHASDMRTVAEMLDKVGTTMSSVYASKAPGTPADWQAVMEAETWYTPEEAVAAGLADRVDSSKVADDATAAFDLTIFAHAGRAAAPPPATKPTQQASGPAGGNNQPKEKGADMASDTLISGLRAKLGVKADAELDDAGLLAALDEVLAEHAEDRPDIPEGTVLIDKAQLDELTASAADGRAARTQQLTEKREHLVQAAVNDGRIPPARKDAWLAMLAADPGAEATLAGLAQTVPLEPIGYTGDETATADDDIYAKAGWGSASADSTGEVA